jgi:uncharacterized protein (TIGR02231 family)
MKSFLLPACFILCTCFIRLHAEPKHFSSTIGEVTVYLQGAMVKRTAEVNLEPGTNEIVFDGLSNYLDINSIRLESGSSITIMSVNASTNYLRPYEKTQTEKQLEASRDTLNLRLARVRNEITAYNNELDMLKQNYKISLASGSSYSDALENSADFYQKRMKEILNELTNLGWKESDYLTKLQSVGNQINEIAGKNTHPYGEITVVASCDNYTKGSFSFSYYVSTAGWTPTYNMRAENTTSNVNLDYDAEVSQTTGEDWKNVKLTLSTGNPSVSGVKPRLAVNRLDFADELYYYSNDRPMGRKGYEKNKMYLNNTINTNNGVVAYGDGDDSIRFKNLDLDKKQDLKYSSDYTNLNQNVLATTFEINLKYDILSDGIAKHVRIQQYSLPAQFTYTALPKACQDAFLEANITGWEEYNLLPGEVNIFLENGFVGKSFIDPSTTKDTLTVSFGKDRKINIKRVRVKNFTKNQFLGSNKIQSFGYATSVRNTKKTPVDIKIEDQIPVSSQKDIVVELKESSGATLDAATGKLIWTLTLQPNEEKTVKFEYTVKYPKSKFIPNL